MTAATLPASRQSIIAVTAFLGLLLATIVWAAAFSLMNKDLQSDFEAKSIVMERLRAQPGVSSRNGSARFSANDMVMAAPTETLAASELQKMILAFVDEAGGAVHSIQAEVGNDVVADGLKHLNAQATFDSSVDALQKALFAIENAVPFIFVDSLVVQPALTSASSNTDDRLKVTLVVSSYWKSFAAAVKH